MMTKTFLLCFVVAGFAMASDIPKVSDATKLEYQDAIIAFQNAAHAEEMFWTDIRKQYEAIQASKARAQQAANAALVKAKTDCGSSTVDNQGPQLSCVEAPKK